MPFRVTEASTSARFVAQITASRQRLATAQEQIGSGKRINRPSDDPAGAGAVIRVRAAQTALEQLKRNAAAANETLLAGDGALEAYETALDRARALLVQGVSDTTNANGRQAVAVELESLRTHMLALANQRYGEQYLFGGTRQEVAPYDANGVPAAAPTAQQLIQIDPDGIPLTSGVTAEMVFADANGAVFQTLSAAAAALRGTGDPVADRAALLQSLDRLAALADQAHLARAQLGASLERATTVTEQLEQRWLALEATAQRTESADFVASAVQVTESQQALDAILQTKALTSRRSLIDLLG